MSDHEYDACVECELKHDHMACAQCLGPRLRLMKKWDDNARVKRAQSQTRSATNE